MAIAHRFVITFSNDNVEATNYQQFGIELGSDVYTPGVPEVTAQIIAYVTGACRWVSDQSTKIQGITHRDPLASVATPVPFPTAEYAALYAANIGDFPKLVGITGYDQAMGETGNPLSPLGTSIVVTEYTAVGGPGGRGRHFLPFVGTFSITGGGYVQPTHRAGVEELYRAFILGDGTGTDTVELEPVVENAAGTSATAITSVKAQPVFSNLESRRR